MAAFSLVNVSEDCYALLLFDASLEDSSDATPDELYAPARRWTCLAFVSSAGSSWFVRKWRMGRAHDGAMTSSIANAATATRVGGLGCEMLESDAACCAGAVPGPTTAVP